MPNLTPDEAKRGLILEGENLFHAIAFRAGISPRSSDAPTLSAARRFAEDLILCFDTESAETQMLKDPEGTRSLLQLAQLEKSVTDLETLSFDHLGLPPYSLFYPFCSWMIAALDRRTKEPPLKGEYVMPK